MNPALSDAKILADLGRRIARIRVERNLTQAQLATEAGLSMSTIVRLERGNSTQLTNLVRVLRVLDLLQNLNALVPEPLSSPLKLLEARDNVRRRASTSRKTPPPPTPWTWGDERPPGATP